MSYRTALDDLDRSMKKAEAGTTLQTILPALEDAAAALRRAQAETPGEAAIAPLAQRLHTATRTLMQHLAIPPRAVQRHPLARQLQRVLEEAQLVVDRELVSASRQEHFDSYQQAALDGGLTRLKASAPFQPAKGAVDTSHLDEVTRSRGLGDTFAQAFEHWLTYTGEGGFDLAHKKLNLLESIGIKGEFTALSHERAKATGQAHGLHEAETAAIRTYTLEDYRYANPAAANIPEWLGVSATHGAPALHLPDDKLTKAQRDEREARVHDHTMGLIDQGAQFDGWYAKKFGKAFQIPTYAPGTKPEAIAQDHLEQARESDKNDLRHAGAELTGVALSGLKKLPPYKGTVYRKDKLNSKRFLSEYKLVGPDQLASRSGYVSWPHLASTSKSHHVAKGWTGGSDPYDFLFELQLTDGKDVSQISGNTREIEVVVLPGQTFKVDSVTVLGTSKPYLLTEGDDRVVYSAHVKAHQVADGASSGAKTVAAARPAAAPGAAAQQAREVVERAKGIEPVVTPDVQAAAKANRGRLKGLEHRFKTETSLARKLDARARTSTAGGTVEERLAKEARKVNDVLRYTVVLPFGTYKEGAAKTRQEMESKGYKTTNYWDAWSQSTTYKGQNLTFTRTALDGVTLPFEVQMHTDETFKVKQKNHEAYEEARQTGTSAARVKELNSRMEARWSKVRVPEGIRSMPAMKM
jgi:hypothetical protein